MRLSSVTGNETAIVLATHGSSSDPRVNVPFFDLARKIQELVPVLAVYPAFLDGAPNVREIISSIPESKLVVIPLMASQGYYTDTVFPKFLQSVDKEIVFASALGTREELAELALDRMLHLPIQSDSKIIIVGHGTRKNKNSCRTTIDLVQKLRRLRPDVEIDFAFVDQNPEIAHVASKIRDRHVVLIPFMMGLGPHVTVDIPEAFGLGDLTSQILEEKFEFPFHSQHICVSVGARQILYDRPIGIYPSIAKLCAEMFVELQNHFKTQQGVAT